MRRVFKIFLVVLLLMTAVTGCSSKNINNLDADKSLEDGLSKGKYVEEDIGFPEGITSNEFGTMAVSPSGDMELYVYNDDSHYEKHLYSNGKWNKVEAKALQPFDDILANDCIIRHVIYGEDKKQYLSGENCSIYQSVLYQLSDAGVYEKIEVKRFKDISEVRPDMYYVAKDIKVLENGMIAASYKWNKIEVYSPDGQSIVGEYNCGQSCVMAVEGNTLYYTDPSEKEILSINMETKEEGTPRPIEISRSYQTKAEVLELFNENAYVCNANGIHLNTKGTSLWETCIDGNQCSLNMPMETIEYFHRVTDKEYYIVLQKIENHFGSYSIKHIFYDENAISLPMIELSIFSIDDNLTIRQAITEFQKNHPEVRINFRTTNTETGISYTYGIKNKEQAIPLKDQINALNTELLAGKGPDILVLDSLPIDSYIEKGVLLDMGSVFDPLKDSGELLPNITDSYYTDGKVYTMPLRFKVPIIYGASDAVNAANSIKKLAKYACNNTEVPLFGLSNYRALAAWLFMTYYNQNLNKEIDEVSLIDFLENVKIISDAIHASDDAELQGISTSNGVSIGYWVAGSCHVYMKEWQSNMLELSGMLGFAETHEVAKKWGGTFGLINNSYKANGLIGINSNGEQKELAKEFIQYLFSEKIQSLDLNDGFPVNKVALEKLTQLDKEIETTIGNENLTISCRYPNQELRNEINKYLYNVDKPMVNDMTVMDMILDEAERYLRGEITVEQAASNIVSSLNLYLSE